MRKLLVFFILGIFLLSFATAEDIATTASDSSSTATTEIQETSTASTEPQETSQSTTTAETQAQATTEIPDSTAGQELQEKVEFKESPGTTPDSPLYFIDDFFDRFGDEIDVKEEKAAEIKAMIEQGNYEDARIALERYKKYADNVEKEADPERAEDVKRSSLAINSELRAIEEKIPKEEKKEFYDDVLEKEKNIVTASEIAGKIHALCRSLSELDPLEYSKVCRAGDNSPNWQKKLDKKLTTEQKEEARKFGEIMSECFKTSGKNCKCNEIPFADFAETCSIASPLAMACDIEGKEEACEKLDNLKMPELPEHLQDVLDELEGRVSESKFDLHMPQECIDAGVKSPKECGIIMIKAHAPEECKEALLKADVSNEREGREICDKLMMQKNAPECAEKGITDPKECKDYMFNIDRRPNECAEQGIHDLRDCKTFMEEGGYEETKKRRDAPIEGFGRDCKSISNAEERLKCYDGAVSGVGDYESKFRDIKDKERECADSCNRQGGRWDFTGGNCKCITEFKEGDKEYSECKDGCSQECPGASRTDCVDNGRRCACFYEERQERLEREEFQPRQEQQPYQQPPQYQQPPEYQQPPTGENQPAPPESFPSGEGGSSTSGSSGGEGTTSSGDGSSGGGESTTSSSGGGESSSSSGGGESSVTGAVISGDKFLDYWFER